ncbi:MAG: SocA family protein [Acidobacteria bacterium]|nr:SocA family protein [Acidobacteriota bacterium]
MANMLRFRFNAEKFVNAVAYLAHACPKSTKLTICKHLYLADKEHLVRYGRPVIGDHYYKLPHGPIPTRGLDVLRGKAGAAENALFEKYVSVIGDSVHPKQPANRKVFSKSDIEVLDWVVKKYGRWSPSALRNETHSQTPWRDSANSCAIDYALFFEGRPEAEEVKELAEREQESRDLLRPYVSR